MNQYNMLNGNVNGFLGNTKLLTVSLQASFLTSLNPAAVNAAAAVLR